MIKYDYKVSAWRVVERNFPAGRDAAQKLAFLLRYAILAPSVHNTQPWKFAVSDDQISVYINTDRWLPVADADQRELHISLGCALENLLIAADHFGYGYELAYFPDPENPKKVAAVRFAPDGQQSTFRSSLFDAIFLRHTNHRPYDGCEIPAEAHQRLQECCGDSDIALDLIADIKIQRQVDVLINHADAIQFANPAFRKELGYWIDQGVFGTPWLISKLNHLAVGFLDVTERAVKADSEVLLGAPVLGLLYSQTDARLAQIKAGQALERIFLTSAALGLSIEPRSQILETPPIKADLARSLPRSDMILQAAFRLGYGKPGTTHTPRRPLEECML